MKENSVLNQYHKEFKFPKYLQNKIDEDFNVDEEEAKSDLENDTLNKDIAINDGTNLTTELKLKENSHSGTFMPSIYTNNPNFKFVHLEKTCFTIDENNTKGIRN